LQEMLGDSVPMISLQEKAAIAPDGTAIEHGREPSGLIK
jgi:hypothetical protein